VYDLVESITLNYLNTRPYLYVVDGYAGYDPEYRQRFRIFCTRAYHALFMRNMLVVPTDEELKRDFSNEVDFYIFNSGEELAPKSPLLKGTNPENQCIVGVNLTQHKMSILGSQYAGEMKKGVFGIMHYLMPQRNVLSMHCSANEGKSGDVSLLFGLSGTGKTTLSADP
jgi:phosphoenolpyruvate carboxykinase (ATP)